MSTRKNTSARKRPSAPATTGTIRHDGWTVRRQATFLQALASTHSVKEAAKAAGMSRQSAYGLRARLKGEPFDFAWSAALQCRFDALAEAAVERALNGVEVPHYYRGELIGTSRRYDERLTVALLAMREHLRSTAPTSAHPAALYRPDAFGDLLMRVEDGPQTWDEEIAADWAEAEEPDPIELEAEPAQAERGEAGHTGLPTHLPSPLRDL